MKNILVVDDNLTICLMLKSWLVKHGYSVETASNVADAIEKVKIEAFDLILSDIRMPDADGFDLLSWMQKYDSSVQVIMMTSFVDIESAVESIKQGAADYIAKPIDAEVLFQKIDEAFQKSERLKRTKDIQQLFIKPKGLDIEKNYNKMIEVISSDSHLLIIGEDGTGKNTAARFIYIKGVKDRGAYVEMDLHDEGVDGERVIDSKLFDTYFEKAKGGMLHIKGLKKAGIQFQTSLISALTKQNKDENFTKIIISTTYDVEKVRSSYIPKLSELLLQSYMELSPIRGDKDTIVSYSESFLEMANRELDKNIKEILPEVYDFLFEQKWDGNIQELKNCIFKMVLLSEKDIIDGDIIPYISNNSKLLISNVVVEKGDSMGGLDSFKKENFERKKITEALGIAKGNKTLAATMLNIDRKTLYNKIRLYGI